MKTHKRILSVSIKRMIDDSPDTSWLGEYSSNCKSEFTIDRAHSEDCIENDTPQKAKLERIASYIENDRPICEDHTQYVETTCAVCLEEKAYTQALEAVQELAECDCGEHGDMERNEYCYFNPSFNYIDKAGHALPEYTPDEVRKYVRQDYERMEKLNRGNWCFLGIRAVAEIMPNTILDTPDGKKWHGTVQRISSGGLWGIESDSDTSYLESVEKDELANLKTELKALGFSSRAISTAFKNVERKED